MFNWKFRTNVLIVLTLCVRSSFCSVTLKVLLQPPIVALECLILNPIEGTSALMFCPNDIMCFQSCTSLCKKDCPNNNITCKEIRIDNGIIYRYTFDTTNILNQGEWTCHYGSQQSSTVLLFNVTKPVISEPTLSRDTATQEPAFKTTAKLPLLYGTSSKMSSIASNSKKGFPIIKPIYVIILLTVFALSLCMNIVFIIRSILTRLGLSSKNSFKPENARKKSCFLKLCIKFFCVETIFKQARHRHSYQHCKDRNPLLTTQLSNNIYESNHHLQPAIILDNGAYINPGTNHRLLAPSMYTRSHSFPAKFMEPQANTLFDPTRVRGTRTIPSKSFLLKPPQETGSQIIYDDVADQVLSNHYPPHHSCIFSTLSQPNQFVTSSVTLNRRFPGSVAMSMSNLSTIDSRVPEIPFRFEESTEEMVLKDAINSRVELSKEMISQADSLLKRAGSLLNDKDQIMDEDGRK